MKAVLYVGSPRTWSRALGRVPWPLVPLGNRPLLEYWIEWCVDLKISEVRLVLGDGADQIESYAGDGSRWGLRIEYAFLRDDSRPLLFLRRAPEQWRDGLLFLSGPLFPNRLAAGKPAPPADGTVHLQDARGCLGLLCRDAAALDGLIAGAADRSRTRPFRELGIELIPVESVKEFYTINMRLAGGEMSRYLAPGYSAADGSCVGYNVVIPPSAEVAPSVIIGNDCRIGPLASVGPCTVIGSHVVIDRQAELGRCVVLDGTYVGRQVEIRNKIAAAGRLIDPEDGEVLELEDTWLLAGVSTPFHGRDVFRAAVGWLLALLLLCAQLAPFVVFCALLRLAGLGRWETRCLHGRGRRVIRSDVFVPAPRSRESIAVRLFYALGLDLAPRVAGAVLGRWWFCGQEPLRVPEDNALRDEQAAYFPGVISYATPRRGQSEPVVAGMEARYYAHARGLREDVGMLRSAFVGRLLSIFGKEGSDGPCAGD
jgi:NDP-sugar pyrophosphorylase family protein